MRFSRKSLHLFALPFVLSVLFVAAVPAQEATPTVTGDVALVGPTLLNQLDHGRCGERIPERAASLVELQFPASEPGDGAIPVATSTTGLRLSITELLTESYAVTIRDPENSGDIVACGAIDGDTDDEGNLFVGLDQVDGSGYSGVVWLSADAGRTLVTVFVTPNTARRGTLADAESESLLDSAAVSLWGKPIDPTDTLDADDPRFRVRVESYLKIVVVATEVPFDARMFEGFFAGWVGDPGADNVREEDPPLYGIGSRAATISEGEFTYDLLAIYDAGHIYLLQAVNRLPAPSAMRILYDIANALFDERRTPRSSQVANVNADAPDAESAEIDALFGLLPSRSEIPAEYQFLDEDVFVVPHAGVAFPDEGT